MTAPTKYQNSKAFRKELEGKGPLPHCFLFLGEEEGEKDKIIQLIVARLIPDEQQRRGAVSVFHVQDDDELVRAAESAISQSMFSSAGACIVRDAEKLPNNKATAGLLREMVEHKAPGTVLIVTSTENRPPQQAAPDILERFKIVQFWKLFDQDLYHYITVSLRKHGMAIDDRAMEQLVELTGRDIKKIDEALDMIRFSGETGEISTEQVRNFVHDVKSISIFDFLDLLFMKDRGALAALKKLVEEGTPELLMLAMILKEAETMERYFRFRKEGESHDDAMKKAGVPPRASDRFARRLDRFDKKSLTALFRAIGKSDAALKSGSGSKDLLMNPLFDLVSGVLIAGDVRSTVPAHGKNLS